MQALITELNQNFKMNTKRTIFLFLLFTGMTYSCSGQQRADQDEIADGAELTTFEEKQREAMASNVSVKESERNESVDLPPAFDFSVAARKVTPGVVHIRSTISAPQGQPRNPFRGLPPEFREFFNIPRGSPQPRQGAGSGVIISADGYIVTNNHVVSGADELRVTLFDNRTYIAEIVGTDPTTDLALIKIDENELPFVEFGSMDNVEVGNWVLAVGNPFSLSSTVTAGIVSATSRSINILSDQAAVESFIQTDAAVNPGNSGGALVDIQGKLVGINTAIASPTGAYAGYAFAVPVDLTKKVVNDLLNYGVVQRGYLGVLIRDVTSELAEEEDIGVTRGVYIDSLVADGSAEQAGLKEGDVIVEVNGQRVNTSPQLQSLVAQKRPGDEIELTVLRNGKERNVRVTLRNRMGGTDIVKEESVAALQRLGLEVTGLSPEEANQLGLEGGGVRVASINPGGVVGQTTSMEEGFIILRVDKEKINSVEELQEAFENKSGGVLVEGVYPGNPNVYYYAFGI